jgi:predicted transposase/invertase (TIGR01784 family)
MNREPMQGDSLETGHKNATGRLLYHVSALHTGQGRGVRYENLKRSVHILFCRYTFFDGDVRFVRRFGFRDEDGVLLSGALGIVTVELTKLRAVAQKPVSEMTAEEQWALFFAYANDKGRRELIDKLIAERSEIKMAFEILQSISKDENERAEYLSRMMAERDMDHKISVREDQVRADVARNALLKNMTVDDIADITGLTRMEIEKLAQ